MSNNDKIPSGIVQFMYINDEIDYPGVYMNNYDSIKTLETLKKIETWLETNMTNTMSNCNLYIDFLKLVESFDQVHKPKILTFVETKTI